jgi:hypothetical protein
MNSSRETYAALFEALGRVDEEVEQAEAALTIATTAQHRARARVWDAIHTTTDAQLSALSLEEEVKKLQTLVLELTAKLKGGA